MYGIVFLQSSVPADSSYLLCVLCCRWLKIQLLNWVGKNKDILVCTQLMIENFTSTDIPWATIMSLQPWHISIYITGAPSQHVAAEPCKEQNITSKCILLWCLVLFLHTTMFEHFWGYVWTSVDNQFTLSINSMKWIALYAILVMVLYSFFIPQSSSILTIEL